MMLSKRLRMIRTFLRIEMLRVMKPPEGDALVKSMRHRKINEDLMTTAESSPSRRDDDDADTTSFPAPSRDTSTPRAPKRPSKLFAEEDEIESIS
jgi:hypothetical protein